MDSAHPSARLHLLESDDLPTMTEAVANFVIGQLARALAEEGEALLAVSGGRSPQPLLERLAREPIDWSRVTVVMVDERAVGLRHPLSNTAAVHGWLIRDQALGADVRVFVPDNAEALDPELLAREANVQFPMAQRITVALLGIGADGHFASIFPDMEALEAAIDPDSALTYLPVHLHSPPSEAPVDRVSLSLACLLRARCLVLPIAGVTKIAALERALKMPDPHWPVSLLIHQRRAPLHVWLARS